jgi:hypothetical protein
VDLDGLRRVPLLAEALLAGAAVRPLARGAGRAA